MRIAMLTAGGIAAAAGMIALGAPTVAQTPSPPAFAAPFFA